MDEEEERMILSGGLPSCNQSSLQQVQEDRRQTEFGAEQAGLHSSGYPD